MNNNKNGAAVLSSIVSKVAQIQENRVEQEIEKYDAILSKKDHDIDHQNSSRSHADDDDDTIMQQWRQKRLQEIQSKFQQQELYRNLPGHGAYEELGTSQQTIDVAKDFFHCTKQSTRMILHFYRPTTELCNIFHAHLCQLAPLHIETRFLKINVQDCTDPQNLNSGVSFLVDRLQIHVMPTLVLIKDQKVIHQIQGCTELGNHTQFSTHHLAYVLGHQYSMIDLLPNEIPDTVVQRHKKNRNATSSFLSGMKGTTRYRYNNNDDDDSGDDDNYEDF
jgi:hypothetical protein